MTLAVSAANATAQTPNGRARARDLGVPPWKVKQVRDQSRSWTPDAIATALRAVATAELDLVGVALRAPHRDADAVLRGLARHS